MAGPIQSAVSASLGATTAAIGVAKGIQLKESKEAAQKVKEAEKIEVDKAKAEKAIREAEKDAIKKDILQQRLETERTKGKTAALKAAQMQQRAKESYISIIREKQLGTKMGTRTSMTDYLIAASGKTLSRDQAREIAGTMSNYQIRKVKEAGGAHGNK